MTGEQILLAVTTAVALVAVVVAVLALRSARRAISVVAERGEANDAFPTVTRSGVEHAAPERLVVEEPSYVITDAGHAPAAQADAVPPQRIEGRLFVDIVARETLVKAASWSHGVRRALAPEVRNRVRFEVRQQARQSRRDRKVEMREALRAYRARQDGSVPHDVARDTDEDAA